KSRSLWGTRRGRSYWTPTSVCSKAGTAPRLLSREVLNILLILITDVFKEFSLQLLWIRRERPFLRIHRRIVNDAHDFHVLGIKTGNSLRDLEVRRVWEPGGIDPRFVIEAGGLHHERLAFPMPDRFAVPQIIGV